MQGQKQTKGLPRIRVRSRFSETGVQRQEIRHLPAFNMRHSVRRTVHRRQNVRALTITLILHLVVVFFVMQSIREHIIVEDDALQIEWVELPPPSRTLIKTRRIQQVKARNDTETVPTPAKIVIPVLSATDTQELPPLDTDALPGLKARVLETQKRGDTETDLSGSSTESRLDRGSYTRSARGRDTSSPIIGDTHQEGSGGAAPGSDLTLAPDEALELSDENLVPEDRLGAILEGEGMEIRGHIRLIRLKHSLSDWWQDPSAIPSFAKWLEENTNLRADMTYAGGRFG